MIKILIVVSDPLYIGLTGCSKNSTADDTGTEAMPRVYAVENTGADCPAPPLPSFNELPVTKFPYDHHELMAMIAPRALLVTGNPDYEWLADESGHVASKAVHEVWKARSSRQVRLFNCRRSYALRAPAESKTRSTGICEQIFPRRQQSKYEHCDQSYNPDFSRWITWDTPQLN